MQQTIAHVRSQIEHATVMIIKKLFTGQIITQNNDRNESSDDGKPISRARMPQQARAGQ